VEIELHSSIASQYIDIEETSDPAMADAVTNESTCRDAMTLTSHSAMAASSLLPATTSTRFACCDEQLSGLNSLEK
jgi:hypothetical protein